MELEITPTQEDLLRQAIQENDLIFVGSVIDVGDPPSYWSGYFPAYQTVRYNAETLIKGSVTDRQINVDHVVVQNSKTAEPGDTPGLSRKIFSTGAKVIVFAVKAKDESWKNLHQQSGVYPFSQDVLKSIQPFIKAN